MVYPGPPRPSCLLHLFRLLLFLFCFVLFFSPVLVCSTLVPVAIPFDSDRWAWNVFFGVTWAVPRKPTFSPWPSSSGKKKHLLQASTAEIFVWTVFDFTSWPGPLPLRAIRDSRLRGKPFVVGWVFMSAFLTGITGFCWCYRTQSNELLKRQKKGNQQGKKEARQEIENAFWSHLPFSPRLFLLPFFCCCCCCCCCLPCLTYASLYTAMMSHYSLKQTMERKESVSCRKAKCVSLTQEPGAVWRKRFSICELYTSQNAHRFSLPTARSFSQGTHKLTRT